MWSVAIRLGGFGRSACVILVVRPCTYFFDAAKMVHLPRVASKMDRRKTGFADISRVSAKLRMP